MLSVKCCSPSPFLFHFLPAYLFLFPLCMLFHLSRHSLPQSPLFSIPSVSYLAHLPPRCVEVPLLPLSFSITEPPPTLLCLPSCTHPPSSSLMTSPFLSLSLSSDRPHANVFVDSAQWLSETIRERTDCQWRHHIQDIQDRASAGVSICQQCASASVFNGSAAVMVSPAECCSCVHPSDLILYVIILCTGAHVLVCVRVCVQASVNNAGLLIALNDWWQRGHVDLMQDHTEETIKPILAASHHISVCMCVCTYSTQSL